MNTAASFILGIDVGGTKIAAGVVDPASGAIIRSETIATEPGRGGAAVLADTVDLAARLIAAAEPRVSRIGVGVPQLVDNEGRIRGAYNFDWTDLSVRERLSALAPATIESDVRAAARAEARFGAGRGRETFAYVTIGTAVPLQAPTVSPSTSPPAPCMSPVPLAATSTRPSSRRSRRARPSPRPSPG
jgi:predicted NBD/HSP70 family sugar kinase